MAVQYPIGGTSTLAGCFGPGSVDVVDHVVLHRNRSRVRQGLRFVRFLEP